MPEFLWRWRREIIFTLLLLVSLGMLVSHHEPGLITRSVRQGVAFVILPFQKVSHGLVNKSRQVFTLFTSMSVLRKENEELKQKLDKLMLRDAQLSDLAKENQALREALNYRERTQHEFIPADIVGRDAASWLRRVVVDRGQADGVMSGAGVVLPNGVVGRITDVNYYSATVMLLPDTQSAVAGRVERSGISGTIKGNNDRTLSMMFVSNEDDVKVGDTIITSALSTLFPPGLPIGDVISVHPSENGLMLDIKVKPRVNFKTINRVLILKVNAEEG